MLLTQAEAGRLLLLVHKVDDLGPHDPTLSRRRAQHVGKDQSLDGGGNHVHHRFWLEPSRERGSSTYTECGRLELREHFCQAPEGRGSRHDTTDDSRDLDVLLVRPV